MSGRAPIIPSRPAQDTSLASQPRPSAARSSSVLAVPDGAGGTQHLHARLPPGAVLSRGQRVGVAMDPARAFVFRAVPS